MNYLSIARTGAILLHFAFGSIALADDSTCNGTISIGQSQNRTDTFGTAALESSEEFGVVVLGCEGNAGKIAYDFGIRSDGESKPEVRLRDLKFGQDVGENGFLILGYNTLNPDPSFGLQPLNLFGKNDNASRFVDRTFEREAAPMARFEYFAGDTVLAATVTQNMRYELDSTQVVGSVAFPVGDVFAKAIIRHDDQLGSGLGASFTTIIGDNLELFGSAFYQRGSARFYHEDALTGTLTFRAADDSPIQRALLESDDVVARAAFGGNFTFPNGNTLLVEVFHDGEGMTNEQWDNYIDIVEFHGETPAPADAIAGNLWFDLQALGNTNMQNYAFSRYSFGQQETEFSVSALINLHDSSTRFSFDVTRTFAERTEVFGTLDINAGCETCEFGVVPESGNIAVGVRHRF